MEDKKIGLSHKGHKKLQDELKERMTTVRSKIADEIEQARELGDLSENSAYKSAMESKDFNETKISELEKIIKNSEIIEHDDLSTVGIGSKVTLKKDGTKMIYNVVGESEADPTTKKISLNSPIGKAIAGKKEGDEIIVNTPVGDVVYKLISIK